MKCRLQVIILTYYMRFLSQSFEMKDLGEASHVIGIEIHRD